MIDSFTTQLAQATTTPRQARQLVAERCAGWPRLDDLLLCVSEVVTNAVLHARSAPTMTVAIEGPRVRVEVRDGDPTPPVRRRRSLLASTGRGLLLLDDLTDRWGTSPVGAGKVVWFELRLDHR
jgi:anti-sigma regulatory factor (Ser/Thr protein kinase)